MTKQQHTTKKDVFDSLSSELKSNDKANKSSTVFLSIRGNPEYGIIEDEKQTLINILLSLTYKSILISEEQNKGYPGFHLHVIIFYGSVRNTVMAPENKVRKQISRTPLKDKYSHDVAIETKYISGTTKSTLKSREILISYCTKNFDSIDLAIADKKLIISDPDNLIFAHQKIIQAKSKYFFQKDTVPKTDKYQYVKEFFTINSITLDFENKLFIHDNNNVISSEKVNELFFNFIQTKNIQHLNIENILNSIFTKQKVKYNFLAYKPELIFTTKDAIVDVKSRQVIKSRDKKPMSIKHLYSEPLPTPDREMLKFYMFNVCNSNVDNIMRVFYPDLFKNYKKSFSDYQPIAARLKRIELLKEIPEFTITIEKKEPLSPDFKFEKMKVKDGTVFNESNIEERRRNRIILTSKDIDINEFTTNNFFQYRHEYQQTFLELYEITEIIELNEKNYTIHINSEAKRKQFRILKDQLEDGKRLFLLHELILEEDDIVFYIQELASMNKQILNVRNNIHNHINRTQKTLWIHSQSIVSRHVFVEIIFNFLKLLYSDFKNSKIGSAENKKLIWKDAKTKKIITNLENYLDDEQKYLVSSKEDIEKDLEKALSENKISIKHKEECLETISKIHLSDEHENISTNLYEKVKSLKGEKYIDSLITNIIFLSNDETYALRNMIQLPTLPPSITISV